MDHGGGSDTIMKAKGLDKCKSPAGEKENVVVAQLVKKAD